MKTSSTPTESPIVALLNRHGILPTRQRVEIAEMLLARDQHLTADQVLAHVNADGARISKATVYNTLGLLASKGLIKELVIDPGRVVYDSNLSPHYHLYNVDTGQLTDFSTEAPPLDAAPYLPPGTTAVGIDVVIRVRNNDPAN